MEVSQKNTPGKDKYSKNKLKGHFVDFFPTGGIAREFSNIGIFPKMHHKTADCVSRTCKHSFWFYSSFANRQQNKVVRTKQKFCTFNLICEDRIFES